MAIRTSEKYPVKDGYVNLGVFNARFGLAQLEAALRRRENYAAANVLLALSDMGTVINRCGAFVARQLEHQAQRKVDARTKRARRKK